MILYNKKLFFKKCAFFFRYYRRDKDVRDDKELQAFVNELSIDGTGPDGGSGQVRRMRWCTRTIVFNFSLSAHMYNFLYQTEARLK